MAVVAVAWQAAWLVETGSVVVAVTVAAVVAWRLEGLAVVAAAVVMLDWPTRSARAVVGPIVGGLVAAAELGWDVAERDYQNQKERKAAVAMVKLP